MTIKLKISEKIRLINSFDVFTVMQAVLKREDKIDKEKEHFWMIGLASDNHILYIELVSLGSVKATTVEPMNVFRVAVLKGAVSVIMVHNHPSGNLIPSAEDKDLSDRLIQVGRILNIKVIEHLIISPKSYFSFVDSGLLTELEQSNKWIPKFELIEKIRKQEQKIREELIKNAEEKALKKGKIEMARGLKKDGVSIEIIAKNSGLTKQEIQKLK